MDGELVISPLLETATDDDITTDDETATELPKDNTDVLLSIPRLELILMDGKLVTSALLERETDEDITSEDKATKELSEDNADVLSSIA